jgi:hypothetical protein
MLKARAIQLVFGISLLIVWTAALELANDVIRAISAGGDGVPIGTAFDAPYAVPVTAVAASILTGLALRRRRTEFDRRSG